MEREIFSTHEKALKVNLEQSIYGTFAEIGAGQEVARWFFRVGGAAGTIAKSMSAYDMTFSDAIYGCAQRYVCRERLGTMLDHEYRLLFERLHEKRGDNTTFFVFADTVAAKSFRGNNECHGWLGVRLQLVPNGAAHEIFIHVRMLDRDNPSQQEALGIIGVNLIFGAFFLRNNPDEFIDSLLDGLSIERIEVDMLKFVGPDFVHVDNRLLSLRLVRKGLTNAAVFSPDGEVQQASEILYKRAILLERGRFRPVTKVNADMLAEARKCFLSEPQNKDEEILEIMEITMRNLLFEGDVDGKDFLARVELLGALGKTVMISNYAEFHRLAAYLTKYTKKMVGIVVGIPLLKEILDDKYYGDLEGGILESFGRLFKNAIKLYIYPSIDRETKECITALNLRPPGHLRHLYLHLLENEHILPLECNAAESVGFSSRDVEARIEKNDASWENMVDPIIAGLIKERKLFGYR